MYRLGNQFIEQKLGMLRHKNGFFGNARIGKVLLHVFQIMLDRNNMFLQKSRQIVGNMLINATQGGIGRFGYSKHPIHALDTRLCVLFPLQLFRHT